MQTMKSSNIGLDEASISRRRRRNRALRCLAPLLLLARQSCSAPLHSEGVPTSHSYDAHIGAASRPHHRQLVNRQNDGEENQFRRKGNKSRSSKYSSKGKGGTRRSDSSESSSSLPSSSKYTSKGKKGKGSSSSDSSASRKGPAPAPRTIQDLIDFAMGRTISNACQLNAQGLYGDKEAAEDRTNDVYIIDYFYQVSVVAGTSTTDLKNVILPELDTAIPTAILSRFFDCEANSRRMMLLSERKKERQVQEDGVVEAISSLPTDMLVLSGLTCAKTIPDSDCYIAQGSNTVVTRDFPSQQAVERAVKEAIQGSMLYNAVLSEITSGLVMDVTYLSNDLQTMQPGGQPAPSPPASPVSVPSPTSTGGGETSSPALNPTPASPAETPTIIPLGTRPTLSPGTTAAPNGELSDTGSPSISGETPTDAPDDGGGAVAPVGTDEGIGEEKQTSDSAGGGGAEWWAWLLAAVGGVAVILCCVSIFRCRGGFPLATGRGGGSVSKSGDNDALGIGSGEADADAEDSPPIGNSYVPPGMGGFSMTSDKAEAQETAPFVNDAAKDDGYEEEEEEETYTEEGEDEEFVVEEEETFEEEEEDEEGENLYYEEEAFEEDESAEDTWGNPQKTYGGRY